MKLAFLIILSSFINLSLAFTGQQLATRWTSFIKENNRSYSNRMEEALRFQIFKKNLEFIENHNAKADAGEFSYRLAINQFGDMTPLEFSKIENGFDSHLGWATSKASFLQYNATIRLPKAIDWRSFMPPIKNQGKCGSCWAFSTTGSIEGHNGIKTGKIVSFSEQQLIDCSTAFGNNGCNGGFMNNVFRYIIQNNGLNTESVYPYEARDGVCRYNIFDRNKIRISNYIRIPRGNEAVMEQALLIFGPISVAVDASLQTFQFYSSGVYNDPNCKKRPESLNHAVVLVGYSQEGNQPYWILRNSWGKTWGNRGYMKISKGRNQCGIATDSSFPVL